MKTRLLCASTIFAASCYAAPAIPRFEVVSIKECGDTDHPGPGRSSPGRLSMSCWPLRRLIQDAYDIFESGKVDPLNPAFPLTPVEGGPGWMNSARYSINAIAESPQSVAMMRGPMMQRLLEDRFALRSHRETRDVPVYLMTVANGGPKLQLTPQGACKSLDPLDLTQSLKIEPGDKPWCVITPPSKQGQTMVWDVRGMSLHVFSKMINPGLPVIDRTGLTGTFDIHLEWTIESDSSSPPDPGTATDPPGTSLIAAIRRQLGLRLDRGKGPREFFVIDHLEKPSEN